MDELDYETKRMTEQEGLVEQITREKIAEEIGEWCWKDSFYGEYVTENDRNSCRIEAGLVLNLIKEALPELAKEAGYVKLAKDQTLPEIPEFAYDKLEERRLLKRGAINYSKLLAGWRRVNLPKNRDNWCC